MVKKTKIMCECAVMLALSIALSYVEIYKMPMGGSITLLSMLPVLFVGVKHGLKWGLGTSLLFAAFQLIQGIAGGNVFVYCNTAAIVILCALFDYIVPFGILGLSGFAWVKKHGFSRARILLTFSVLIAARFVCHFITGVFIWGQWAEGMSRELYSLIYNGQYMLPELILTIAAAAALTAVKPVRQLLCEE
jgi:thiamine transporter